MLQRISRMMMMVGVLGIVATSPAWAQGEMQMGAPDELKAMAGMEGTWDVDFSFRMDPSQEFETTKGTSVIGSQADGCTQTMTLDVTMMGMPYKGYGLTCYNRDTKLWESVWVDNMSAHLSSTTGTMTDGKMVLTGKDTMGGMSFDLRQTTFNITADRFEWTMEFSMDGGTTYMTTGKAVYTRKK